ncbi:hypothetical protein [Streptomyces malaysiensis]|uniref:Uncharacterized protein n=1 Tax=Streptomyces malaysiensis subsp. samsunensis TaxID=459658 RepID=A0A9X2LYF1_STRMQ|nr:hypothetical protein [Streptomyces samsunensis]MCQ8831849.1 hypothetical protein [Streptomyces samsunensis]
MSAPLIAVDPALLMLLVIRIAVLTDAVDAARQAVEAEQESHSAYRLANPPRRETP